MASSQSLQITGMSCAACQVHVRRALENVPGVVSAEVNLLTGAAEVVGDADAAVLGDAVRRAGYGVARSTKVTAGTGRLGLRAVVALVAGAAAMGLSMMMGGVAWVRWVELTLAVGVMAFAAPEIYSAAWRAAKAGSTNMNTLVALGTGAAMLESVAAVVTPGWFARRGMTADVYFEAVVLILAFLLVGRWLEARAKKRAVGAVEEFAKLESPTARWLASADALNETLMPTDAIEAGDFVRVLAGERVPVDGEVAAGRSSVDVSMLTGEPLPVVRGVGERVTAGSLNLDGVLVVRATAVGAASTVAQMRRLLEQAQNGRAGMQRIADRASAVFVPVVIGLAAVSFAGWMLAGGGFARALTVAVAVLIVACPCAMGLAVPAAMSVAVGRAAELGLLIKGGEAMERLAAVEVMAMDKTGTLTMGQPRVVSLRMVAGFSEKDVLRWAKAVERTSTHPLARAVVEFAADAAEVAATEVVVEPGCGMRGRAEGHSIGVGSLELVGKDVPVGQLQDAMESGGTPVAIVVDGELAAVMELRDEVRGESRAAVEGLRGLGVTCVMVTGDIEASARLIAEEAGITEVRAKLLPEEKVAVIRQLQAGGKRVAMVGDGINDAAAMAAADAGIAMAAGTDLAREAGDVLLLHEDLRLVPLAISVARKTLQVMRQNLVWALGYNVLALPLAMGVLYPRWHVLLSPVVASAAMAMSSVSVLGNSLRLRGLNDGK